MPPYQAHKPPLHSLRTTLLPRQRISPSRTEDRCRPLVQEKLHRSPQHSLCILMTLHPRKCPTHNRRRMLGPSQQQTFPPHSSCSRKRPSRNTCPSHSSCSLEYRHCRQSFPRRNGGKSLDRTPRRSPPNIPCRHCCLWWRHICLLHRQCR